MPERVLVAMMTGTHDRNARVPTSIWSAYHPVELLYHSTKQYARTPRPQKPGKKITVEEMVKITTTIFTATLLHQ